MWKMRKMKYKLEYLDENQNTAGTGCRLFSYKHIVKNDLQTLEVDPYIEEINLGFASSSEKSTDEVDARQTEKSGSSSEVSGLSQNNTVSAEVKAEITSVGGASFYSFDSLSSISASKPDVVQCTKHSRIHVEQDSEQLRNRRAISTELLKGGLRVTVVPPQTSLKRHHSFGDELGTLVSESGHSTSEGLGLSGRSSSLDFPVCRENSGLWVNKRESTVNGGLWMRQLHVTQLSNIDDAQLDWRLPLDPFTSKRQGSKRKAKHVSRRSRSYYKNQDELIKSFVNIRYDIEGEKTDINQLRRKVSSFAKITFIANLVLLIIKIVAVVMSGSVSLISSLVDSSVDLISGVVIWVTTRLVKKTDRYRYPQGRAKLEPIAIVILSVIMGVASLHLVEETIEKIVHLASGDSEPPNMEAITLGISSVTVVVKLVLYFICRKVPHHTIQALALDHRNDVISNTAAIIFGYIGSKEMQAEIDNSAPGLIYLDPAGAILICIYITISWGYTGWGQIKMLTGHTARPNFHSRITWICLDHHEKIKKINSVRAFHFGNSFLVEISVVLPENMTVQEAHDVIAPLEQKLERLSEVERAFVHIDYRSHDNK